MCPHRFIFLILVAAWGAGCRVEEKPTRSNEVLFSTNSSVGSRGSDEEFRQTLPQTGGPAGYAGSQSCTSCHEDQHDSWFRSYHRTMTQYADTNSVQANFHNVILTNDGTRLILSQRTNEFWVRMEKETPSGPEHLDARIGLITGSHHMQVFWVPGGEGNAQIGFPFTWLIPEKRWVPRGSTFIRPPDLPHRSEIWNVVCSRCHATGIEPRVDAAARTVNTRAAELGISCEACHGPGQRHVELRLAQTGSPKPAELATEIVHPRKIEPARASQICGFCHSMKWIDQSENWRQAGFRYRPGDDLEETTPIIRPSRVEDVPGLAQFLARSPELLHDFFWSDGMIRVSGREYNGLIESPCAAGGKFSCLSCHSMHESDPDDLLAVNRVDNRACTQCHEQLRDAIALQKHSRHAAGSSGSECYNCHMPHTTYGVLKAIRSHQISSPKISEQKTSGRPNACNLCHLDKTLSWTQEHLANWYGQSTNALTVEEGTLADSVRLALKGDAGQRALMAWHFGWAPARAASGGDWIPPVLAELLEDPYAAVRCIAERSLKQWGDLLPPEFDYTLKPSDERKVRSMVTERWQESGRNKSIPTTTLVESANPGLMRERFDALKAQRDQKPVRLRE